MGENEKERMKGREGRKVNVNQLLFKKIKREREKEK